eukprot:1159537-Pelagomonas_calceolata.AAC.4
MVVWKYGEADRTWEQSVEGNECQGQGLPLLTIFSREVCIRMGGNEITDGADGGVVEDEGGGQGHGQARLQEQHVGNIGGVGVFSFLCVLSHHSLGPEDL